MVGRDRWQVHVKTCGRTGPSLFLVVLPYRTFIFLLREARMTAEIAKKNRIAPAADFVLQTLAIDRVTGRKAALSRFWTSGRVAIRFRWRGKRYVFMGAQE